MALIMTNSPECLKSEVDLFALPPTQTAIEGGEWIEFLPLSSIKDGPIEFNITGSTEDYIDLSSTQLHVKLRVTKKDGKPLLDTDLVSPANLPLHSLFSQVDVSLNGRNITNSSHTYPYRAYIETLLNYGRDAKMGPLTMEGFHKDTAGSMADHENNEGMKERSKHIANSRSYDLLGRVHCSLFFQQRLLLNLVDVKLRLVRSKPSFFLISSTADYNVHIDHASLFVRKVRVNPAVAIGHAKALEKTTAKYPINRVLCKVYSVAQGSMSFVQDNVYLGAMPQRVIIGLVDNESFNGTFRSNPFDFKHYDLNFVSVYVDGRPVPHKPLEPNFETGNTVRAYNNLFRVEEDRGIDITREEFHSGYTLFCFSLLPDQSDCGHLHLVKHSNLRVELKFAKALPKTISVIIYGEFQNLIEITKSRSVLCDFSG